MDWSYWDRNDGVDWFCLFILFIYCMLTIFESPDRWDGKDVQTASSKGQYFGSLLCGGVWWLGGWGFVWRINSIKAELRSGRDEEWRVASLQSHGQDHRVCRWVSIQWCHISSYLSVPWCDESTTCHMTFIVLHFASQLWRLGSCCSLWQVRKTKATLTFICNI